MSHHNPLPEHEDPTTATYIVWSELNSVWEYMTNDQLYSVIKPMLEADGIVFPTP